MDPTDFLVSVIVSVPALVVGFHGNADGLPEEFVREPRFNCCQWTIRNGIPTVLEPTDPEDVAAPPHPGLELGRLLLLASGQQIDRVIDGVGPIVEDLADQLTFQMQVPVRVVSIDVSGSSPDGSGQVRTVAYAGAEGFVMGKFRGPIPNFQWSSTASNRPMLAGLVGPLGARERKALFWYSKSLVAASMIDQFVALWVALETLIPRFEFGLELAGKPLRLGCGHELPTCPACAASTARPTGGDKAKAFLTDRGGMTVEYARKAWQIRQLLHGHDIFIEDQLEDLGATLPALRAAIITLIRAATDWQLPVPQMTRIDGPILGALMALSGTRSLTEADAAMIERLRVLRQAPAHSPVRPTTGL
ncbi:hypothetical protein H5397_16950 [Propioniciclava sp. MC1683]|uniref:hypothetical protein n=1 Tax=Propioniciclava sp. MC1683 TaxID=2760309 RepID=UPI001601D4AB|nr:hypothetical protein [Propioniciclava sp. MC1683]MBB1503084.1 hypothetical protein [Propioniciclava sp. MC1683]